MCLSVSYLLLGSMALLCLSLVYLTLFGWWALLFFGTTWGCFPPLVWTPPYGGFPLCPLLLAAFLFGISPLCGLFVLLFVGPTPLVFPSVNGAPAFQYAPLWVNVANLLSRF